MTATQLNSGGSDSSLLSPLPDDEDKPESEAEGNSDDSPEPEDEAAGEEEDAGEVKEEESA